MKFPYDGNFIFIEIKFGKITGMFNTQEYINKPRWQESRLGLERIAELLKMLGNPQKNLKFVHVAGTNGKGSTCAYLSQIFVESGYKTGLFTSPFVYEFNERIRINNQNISDDDLTKYTLVVKEQADKFPADNHPTEFELMTAVAFLYFSERDCDVVVCEVGLGGRLDSTNVIDAQQVCLSIITPIHLDHTQFLGDTIEKVASEKAGIFKSNTAVLSAVQKDEATRVLESRAKELGCNLNFVNPCELKVGHVDIQNDNPVRNFSYKDFHNLKTELLAFYQPENAMLAIDAAMLLQNEFTNISKSSIEAGITKCRWPGRFEIIETNPYVIIDGGHNVQGTEALIESLLDVFGNRKFTFIMGVLVDKNYKTMVQKIAPYAKKVFTVTPPNPRKLESAELTQQFREYNIDAIPVDIQDAISIAKESATPEDVICAFGSLYSLKDLISNY